MHYKTVQWLADSPNWERESAAPKYVNVYSPGGAKAIAIYDTRCGL